MNHDEIIAMAKEARISEMGLNIDGSSDLLGLFERFAALVAAKERERFALECIDIVALHGGSVEIEAAIRARSQQ